MTEYQSEQDCLAGKVQTLEALRGQMAVLDAAIDQQIYGLYGLSAAGIALVDGLG